MDNAELLKSKALYLTMGWTMIGTRRHQGMKGEWADEAHAQKDPAQIAKVTVRSDTLKAIWGLKGGVQRMTNHYGCPSSQAKRRVVPTANVATVEAELLNAQDALGALATKLGYEWPNVVADASERLGDLFDAGDYPSAEEVADMFSLTWRWLPIADTPEMLRAVAADAYEGDLKRARDEIAADLATMRMALRGSLVEIIRRMRMTLNKPSGETRRFGKKFFSRLNAFTEQFTVKNLSDDVTMSALVSDLANAARGIDVTSLKNDEAAQAALDVELGRIQSVLTSLSEETVREIAL